MCLGDKVILWCNMVPEGKWEDDFPGLNQEGVDRGERGRGEAGGSRANQCLLVFTLFAKVLETRPVHPEAVHSPFLARRPRDRAYGKSFLCLQWEERGGGPHVFLGIVPGNPGLFQGYSDPDPVKTQTRPQGMGFTGYGYGYPLGHMNMGQVTCLCRVRQLWVGWACIC